MPTRLSDEVTEPLTPVTPLPQVADPFAGPPVAYTTKFPFASGVTLITSLPVVLNPVRVLIRLPVLALYRNTDPDRMSVTTTLPVASTTLVAPKKPRFRAGGSVSWTCGNWAFGPPTTTSLGDEATVTNAAEVAAVPLALVNTARYA